MVDLRRSLSIASVIVVIALDGCADEPAVCAPGARSCPCDARGACGDGLVCDAESHVCEGTRAVRLPAIDPDARSCELLLEDGSASVAGAEFAATVRGAVIRQSPRTAVTFFGLTDAPIGGDAVRIQLVGGGAMRIARARCFDRLGHLVPDGIASDG